MSYRVLLLAFVLVGFVAGQSTTVDSSSTSAKATAEKETSNKDGEAKITTADMENMKPDESVDKFTFTKADAMPVNQQIQMEDKRDPIKEHAEDDALVIFETILNGGKESPEEEDVITLTNDKDGDNNNDNDDDDEDEIDEEFSSDSLKPLILNPSDIQIRRQGDVNPEFEKKEKNGDSFAQKRQDTNNPRPYSSPYITTKDRIVSSDSVADNSPLLQLTQGGYQRPYNRRVPFNMQRPGLGSAPQQSETVERTVGTQSDGNQRPPIVPQVTYASAYQPQMEYGAMPMFRHPLDPARSFVNTNGPTPHAVQSGFFNPQPAPFPDFTSANIQSPFAMPGNGFSEVSRDANGFSQYQVSPMANPSLLFQSPHPFVQPQPMSDGIQRPVHNVFQTGSFAPYAAMNNVEDSPRPDYSAYFRSPSSMNAQQFHVSPNFFGTHPNGAGSGFNGPTINFPPGYSGSSNGSPFSSRFQRYPVAVNPSPPQNTDQQVQRQQQNSETDTTDQKTRDSDMINVSPDKEDPISVPFGTRIQRENDFEGPRDVYIRYPMTEAGYATEENLPVQNITEKNTEGSVASQRPVFPFFTAARPNPGFSSPDPYRNALNALQQGYPGESRRTNSDDSNNTNENAAEQLARNMPLHFNQGPLPPPSPVFRGYPEGSRDLPEMQRTPFYSAVGADSVRSPFDQIPVFPERSYPFPEPVGNAAEANITPTCAKESNASLCFNDPEYPRRELLYALNSDSFLMERLVMPDQQLDRISLVEQNTSESPESQDNYICKSDLKYGMPLRAKNIKGVWKVIVNIERAIGGGKFIQPVRLEVCREANEPCSFATEIKTACVQKYSLQRLLSWNAEKGVHNDVYKLPVACSCQVVNTQV